MVSNTDFSIDQFSNSFEKSIKDQMENFSKFNLQDINLDYVAYDENRNNKNRTPLGYGSVKVKLTKNSFPTHCYTHIYVKNGNNDVKVQILRLLIKSVQPTPITTLFFFVETLEEKEFYEKNKGIVVEDGARYELKLSNSVRSQLLSLIQGDKRIKIKVIINPNKKELLNFVQIYNEANMDQPSGNATRQPSILDTDTFFHSIYSSSKDIIMGFAYYEDIPAGITIISLTEHRHNHAYQRFTGVLRKYRSRGIAKRLKVWVISYLIDKFPERKILETENLDENVEMRVINDKLGFKQVSPQITIEIPIKLLQ